MGTLNVRKVISKIAKRAPRKGTRVAAPSLPYEDLGLNAFSPCKAVDAGSIPTPASSFFLTQSRHPSPGGETGRHKGLKIPRRVIPSCRFDPCPGHHRSKMK